MPAKIPGALVVLAVSGLALVGPTAALAQPKAPPPGGEPSPAEAEYTQHMKNGIQLYELKHYAPAAIEFDAAYKAKPSASPLINQALCYREQMKYPQAVATLKKALAEHGASLDPANKAAAQKAIDEMSPLLAYVTLKLDPADATATIDGEDLQPDANGEIQVGPNEHAIVVTRDGFDPLTDRFSVASGEHKVYEAKLESRLGTLDVFAPQDDVDIEIDGKVVGRGHWAGPLERGNHAVRFGADQDPVAVTLSAKQTTVLDRRVGPKPPAAKPKAVPAAPQEATGFYVFVEGGVLYPTLLPIAFQDSAPDTPLEAANYFGAMAGARAGYRLNTYAAFEGSFNYSNVTGGRQGDDSPNDPASYSFSSWRLGPSLRLMSPGKVARFVGAVGGGLAFHSMAFSNVEGDPGCTFVGDDMRSFSKCSSGWGVDFYFTADAGVEFNIGHVILGARLELSVDGTKGSIDYDTAPQPSVNPFDSDPIAFIGPVAHFGYSSW